MIVQITGTYGSGKSTAVRTLLPLLPEREDVHCAGRRMALGHVLGRRLFLVGDYFDGSEERTWVGADTIKDLDLVFSTVREQHALERHVVMEGTYLMSMKRCPQLQREFNGNYVILQLVTSLEESVIGINARRARQGDGPLENLRNVTSHYRKNQTFCAKMKFLGVPVHKVTRESAPGKLRELLSI